MSKSTETPLPVGSDGLFACPFCGFEEPEIETHQNWCPNCGARGPDELEAWGMEGEPSRPRSIQAAWNRRSSPWCEACKEPDCKVSGDGTCAMIRKYLANDADQATASTKL